MMDWSDAVRVGDPDPTMVRADDEYDCCPAHDGRYHCTREEGHSKRHIAGDGYEVCAVWL